MNRQTMQQIQSKKLSVFKVIQICNTSLPCIFLVIQGFGNRFYGHFKDQIIRTFAVYTLAYKYFQDSIVYQLLQSLATIQYCSNHYNAIQCLQQHQRLHGQTVHFQNNALLFMEIKIKLILLGVATGLIWKTVRILYTEAVSLFCVFLTYTACSCRTSNYDFYSCVNIIQNLNQSLNLISGQTLELLFYLSPCLSSRTRKTSTSTLPCFSLLEESVFAYILVCEEGKKKNTGKRSCIVQLGRKSFWSFSEKREAFQCFYTRS